MSGVGFGKPPQALHKKRKCKKAEGKDEYVLIHQGQDGCTRVLRLEARSLPEAEKKFDVFIKILNLCLSGVADEEILHFMEEHPL